MIVAARMRCVVVQIPEVELMRKCCVILSFLSRLQYKQSFNGDDVKAKGQTYGDCFLHGRYTFTPHAQVNRLAMKAQ